MLLLLILWMVHQTLMPMYQSDQFSVFGKEFLTLELLMIQEIIIEMVKKSSALDIAYMEVLFTF